ncbi:hypothetical protein ACFWIW_14055 [Amycolatopsis sp. NPDC058340]|uniref:hypothetical protein n=1 Tax=Amycolatopsis sp. NPDC058340 TaxID=3346453 RepID=UPI00366330EF
MFGRNRYLSYVEAWRATALGDAGYAIRRNIIVVATLVGIDLLVLDGSWLAWPVRAVLLYLGWNTYGWLRFRSRVRRGLIFPPEQPRSPFGGPEEGRGWRHG